MRGPSGCRPRRSLRCGRLLIPQPCVEAAAAASRPPWGWGLCRRLAGSELPGALPPPELWKGRSGGDGRAARPALPLRGRFVRRPWLRPSPGGVSERARVALRPRRSPPSRRAPRPAARDPCSLHLVTEQPGVRCAPRGPVRVCFSRRRGRQALRWYAGAEPGRAPRTLASRFPGGMWGWGQETGGPR